MPSVGFEEEDESLIVFAVKAYRTTRKKYFDTINENKLKYFLNNVYHFI